MKTAKILTIWVLALGLLAYSSQLASAGPMGTAFTYQGQLYDASYPANGRYDFAFKLYDANVGGNKLGTDVNVADANVIDGYFTVELDFGSMFDGNACWLGIGIRPGYQNDPCAYTFLSPRQEVTPTPYSVYAQDADKVDGYHASDLAAASTDEKVKASSGDATAGYLDAKVDNSTIEVSNNVLRVKNGGISASKISAALGSNSSKSVNTIYQAATDGFVVAYSNRFGNWGAIYGYTDLSNPPTTKIADNNGRPDEEFQNVFICFPVNKGNYWKVSLDGNASSATITWIPLGT